MHRSKQISASASPHRTSPAATAALRTDRLSTRLRSRLGFAGDGLGYRIARRALDIVGSLTVLVLASPLMLVIAVLIKRDSPGPVLFKHVRIGINRRRRGASVAAADRRGPNQFGEPFVLYKFRTMYSDSRERFPELYAYDYSVEELSTLPIKILVGPKNGGRWVDGTMGGEGLLDDPRVTPFGRWLRKTSLDELPNFINVLKGDMHLVGPRADIVENIRYYPELHRAKLDVKPGVTGLAQINGRGRLSFLQTNEYDLEYVRNRSLLLDLKVIFRTIVVTVKGDGAF
jgi:lipopolysaccharide/colanic/teichoic acid biosynthesis glycosyltransferase